MFSWKENVDDRGVVSSHMDLDRDVIRIFRVNAIALLLFHMEIAAYFVRANIWQAYLFSMYRK